MSVLTLEEILCRVSKASRLVADSAEEHRVDDTVDNEWCCDVDHAATVLEELERDLLSDLLSHPDSAGISGGSEERRSAPTRPPPRSAEISAESSSPSPSHSPSPVPRTATTTAPASRKPAA